MAIETNGMLAARTDPVCLIKETIDDAPYQMFIQKNKKKMVCRTFYALAVKDKDLTDCSNWSLRCTCLYNIQLVFNSDKKY